MKQDYFVQMLDQFQKNLEELYQNANTNDYTCFEESKGLLSAAYKELGTASEELQIALEELMIKSEELAATRIHLEAERQHYKNIFESLPDAYIITNSQGNIIQANQASAALLNVETRFLKNKPIDIFLASGERQVLMAKLSQINRCQQRQNWVLQLQPRNGEQLEIEVTTAPNFNSEGQIISLHWSLRNLTKDKKTSFFASKKNSDLILENPKYTYQQGEIVPLHPDSLWIVTQGWVKLTTIAESAEEIVIGLVGESMPFGSSLTSLPTYQATALSQKTELVCVPLTYIYSSPNLVEIIFPQIIERLQHTESLLAISGIRQVQERINYLLFWLKQNFGEKTLEGYRLKVRLTHQELANACGTTRVTITRVLSQLKKQGKINYDAKHHLIFL